jgi:purine-binding chemotaxis protein CheW
MEFANALSTASNNRTPAYEKAATDENSHQFMTFTLGEAEYGIDIMAVREIKGWTETTIVPNAPSHVRGVINLRGIVVPIFDLRVRFGMGRTNATQMHVVIIVSIETRTIGLLVDAVSDIIAVNADAIQPMPEIGLPKDETFLDGLVSAAGGRLVTLVSLKVLFGSQIG